MAGGLSEQSLEPIPVFMTTADLDSRTHIDEIGGLRTIWHESDGPFSVCLMARCGRADETLSAGGITHFVEHMALAGAVTKHDLVVNGAVDMLTTSFWATGDRDDVLAHLGQVLRHLAELPLERLETERSVLLTEMDRWDAGLSGTLSVHRFGAHRHGLVGYPQFGLEVLTGGNLQDWSHQWFTKANMVLAVHGRPPESLDVPLPQGEHRPPPAIEPVPWRTFPSENPYGYSGAAALGMLAPRSYEGAACATLIARRMVETLRHERGLSYHPTVNWIRLNLQDAQIDMLADVRDDAHAALARDLMNDIVVDLAGTGPTATEMEFLRSRPDEDGDADQQVASLVANGAYDLALGTTPELAAQREEAMRSLDAESVRQVGERMASTRLAEVGPGVRRSALPSMRLSASGSIVGRRLRARRGGTRLTIGTEGIAVTDAEGIVVVRFAECVGCLSWSNGTRSLISSDGSHIMFAPSAWRASGGVTEQIDAAVNATVVVEMDRSLQERAARVAEAAAAQRGLSIRAHRALDLLSSVIQDEEPVLVVGEAKTKVGSGLRAYTGSGVLALTNWRLIFTCPGADPIIMQRADIETMDHRRGTSLFDVEARLRVTINGTRRAFTIRRGENMRAIVAELESDPIGGSPMKLSVTPPV